jgi:hypothetical protein
MILKRIVIVFYVLFAFGANAQSVPQWRWGRSDTSIVFAISPGYIKTIVAAGNNKMLWGTLQNDKMNLNEANGDYVLAEFDTSGNQLNSTVITGTLHLVDAKADDAGNWYVLGQYYDSLHFASGLDATRNPSLTSPDYFIARFDAGTLALHWFKHVGAEQGCTSGAFVVRNNTLYVSMDSAGAGTKLYKMDLQTGDRTDILTQNGQSITSSIEVDSHGNIYLAGSCAFSGIDFNGHFETGISGYPAYMVRYKANGQYDWSYWMADVTCVDRALILASDNSIYYSGNVHDTFSLAGHAFHHPAWVYDFMISSFDSTGHLNWARQLPDTLGGDADLTNPYHSALAADGSVYITYSNRGSIDWGNNVTINSGLNSSASVLKIDAAGNAAWVLHASAEESFPEHITASGNGVWITGLGYDSLALNFGAVSLPTSYQHYTPFVARIGNAAAAKVPLVRAQTDVQMVPNPARDYVRVINAGLQGSAQIAIKDVTGRQIRSYVIDMNSSPAINISGISPGLYFVELKTPGFSKTQKMFFQ